MWRNVAKCGADKSGVYGATIPRPHHPPHKGRRGGLSHEACPIDLAKVEVEEEERVQVKKAQPCLLARRASP